MLLPSLTLERLRLASLFQEGTPEPVLTFSFKVYGEGNMADYDVKAGLIRNVTRIDYDGVDELLGTGSIPFGCPFDGPRSPPAPRIPVLETKYIENMHLIHNVIRRYIPIGQQVDVRIKDYRLA